MLALHDDRTAPAAPVITTTAPAQDNASSIDIAGTAEANSTITLYNGSAVVGTSTAYVNAANDTAAQALTGTAEANSTITLYNGSTVVGITSADASGHWSQTIGALGNGTYSYTATATDAAGNTSVAGDALGFTVDTTAPNTSITGHPDSSTTATSASFTWSGSDPDGSSTVAGFYYQLDNGSLNFTTTSTHDFPSLALGSHTFSVYAVDAAGNVDLTPATFGWTITNSDITPPTFNDIIQQGTNFHSFTGNKTNQGTEWKFQVAVSDDDSAIIGQGGIVKFQLLDTTQGTTLGSATYNPSTGQWTPVSFSSVSWANGVYTLVLSGQISTHDTIEVIAYDAAGNSAAKFATLPNNSGFQVAPAGIAGEPINLGLTSPADEGVLVTVTVKELPPGWTLNGATQNEDGSWTVQTNDVGSLTTTTSADFAGALLLTVNMSWTNADGMTSTMVVSDNIEAYASGSDLRLVGG